MALKEYGLIDEAIADAPEEFREGLKLLAYEIEVDNLVMDEPVVDAGPVLVSVVGIPRRGKRMLVVLPIAAEADLARLVRFANRWGRREVGVDISDDGKSVVMYFKE